MNIRYYEKIVITLLIILLASCLLTNITGAETAEIDIYVYQGETYVFEFIVEDTGSIDVELINFKGAPVELVLTLESPTGNIEEVWWTENTGMPLSLTHEVSEKDIAAGNLWKVTIESGISEEGAGLLEVTYPSSAETVIEQLPERMFEKELPKEYEEENDIWYYTIPMGITVLILLTIFASRAVLGRKMRLKDLEKKQRSEKETGSIEAISIPENAWIYLDNVLLPGGLSPQLISEIPVGHHELKFIKIEKLKFWYAKKETIVAPNETAIVEAELKGNEIKLGLSAEPSSIPADGASTSTINIQIEDKHGIPISVPEDIKIKLESDMGMIQNFVVIPKGHASTTAVLESSDESGTTTIKAESKGMLKESIDVQFTDVNTDL